MFKMNNHIKLVICEVHLFLRQFRQYLAVINCIANSNLKGLFFIVHVKQSHCLLVIKLRINAS